MARFETYCQKAFLDSFIDQLCEYLNDYDFNDPVTEDLSYNQLRNLIMEKSDLILDEENLESFISIPFYKSLIKSSTSGGSKIIPYIEHFQTKVNEERFDDCSPHSLHYLTECSLQDINRLYDRNGIFVNSTLCWAKKIRSLTEHKTYNVHPNEEINDFPGWQILSSQNLPKNAFIIVDQYLIDKGALFESNLFEFIRNLLPDSLEVISFDFSIITSRGKNSDTDFLQKRYDKINKFIYSLNKPYQIEFTIWITSSEYTHNRWMLSNYFYLKSEHSFTYFNTKGEINKETELEYFGINARPLKLYINKIKYLKEGLRNTEIIGSGKNRLLT